MSALTFNTQTVSTTIGGRTITLETGRLAKQADGAVLVTSGNNMVLVTVVSSKKESTLDFFPLTRRAASEKIEPMAGIECLVRLGDSIEKGQPLYRLYGPTADYRVGHEDAIERLTRATRIESAVQDKSLQSRQSNALIAMGIGVEL